ncbi:MAG: 8-amino-7-oxononanoate synthase [Spirochaetia bacterium]|nr:8-amino-7-oxononanoate synthase [Spirochaetia bacterium]
MNIENILKNNLEKKIDEKSIRILKSKSLKADFCSNDYLGFSRSAKLSSVFSQTLLNSKKNIYGSTGSRLISGNSQEIETLEKKLARYFEAESALIFNSGYHANIGLLSSIARKSDTIFYDELSHASIRDGIRLSLAKSYSFKHNDSLDLRKKIENFGKNQIFIVTEALFSMDGDFGKLKELAEISEKLNAALIVDEAHSTGIIGDSGKGLAVSMNLEKIIFARVHTFGKALGCFGACVIGSEILRDYLINNARSFIFTTALPYFNLTAIDCALDLLKESKEELEKLNRNIEIFRKHINENIKPYFLDSTSAIHAFILPDNQKIKEVALILNSKGLDVNAILHPSVPKGKERIRITLHSFNTEEEIINLLNSIYEIVKNL